jgi:hypothetical protein
MKARHLLLFLGMFGLQGCASQPLTTFDAYEGAQLPDNELAIIGELHGAIAGLETIARDSRVLWKRRTSLREQVRLKPGRYQVGFILWCASDYSLLATGDALYVGVRKSADLDLIGGHIYSTNGKNAGYLCHNRFTDGAKLWIEDQTANRIVAGDGAE